MIGELKTGRLTLTLDYTRVAAPLDAADVAADEKEFRALADSVVYEIVLWQHQWDWIVRSAQAGGSASLDNARAVGILIGDSILTHQLKSEKFLWGFKVRIAN